VAAGVAALTGCGVLWSLDGLEGGHCGASCYDAGDLEPTGDASGATGDSGGPDVQPDAFDSTAPIEAGPVDASSEEDVPTCAPPDASPALDDCKALASKTSAPVIDGILDCGVPLWDMPQAGWSGTGSVPAGIKTQVGAAWRNDGLYLFVHVTGAGAHRYPAPAGDPVWCGDAVELYVDSNGTYAHPPDYDFPGTMQFVLEAPSDAMTTAMMSDRFENTNEVGQWTGEFITVRTADGFDAEAFIRAADLDLTTWTLAAAGHVGLDVAVDLGDPTQMPASCPLLGQYDIQVVATDAACNRPSCNVEEFCRPVLQ
jgi:hypothetical protein